MSSYVLGPLMQMTTLLSQQCLKLLLTSIAPLRYVLFRTRATYKVSYPSLFSVRYASRYRIVSYRVIDKQFFTVVHH